ncbi:hypothetical protein C4J81_03350 [Deltaproteobacteria bacterium Smac51]|nr:hypothetical protein C4J81_03350 [Deltaproteobacteria bacterium Smac51]
MLKAKTGWSRNEDSKSAGRECALMAAEGLAAVKVAFVYVSSDHDVDELLAGIQEVMPDAPLIGNTSFRAVVLPDGLVGGGCFAGMMALSGDGLLVSVAAARNEDDGVEAGREAALEAHRKSGRIEMPAYCYLAANPGFEEGYIRGIREAVGNLPVFGGSAIDNYIMGDWCTFTDDGRVGDGMAVALFYADKPIANLFTGAAYRETDDIGVITKMEGCRKLIEIDNRPVLERMTNYSGFDGDLLRGPDMMVATMMNPLAVKYESGHLNVHHPMFLNSDDSIAMGTNIQIGDRAIKLETTVDELVEAIGGTFRELRKKMNGTKPGAYHLACSFGRMDAIAERMDEVVAELQEAAEGIPFIMEFTLSEFGEVPEASGGSVGNLMMSFTALPM